MYLKQFYLGCLSQASYMIGSNGEAAVVDPRRDVEVYLSEAKDEGLQIKHVLETHFHADFVSGHRELASRTGARIYFGRRANPGYAAVALADGDEVKVGDLALRTLETPGHTPESVCYVVEESGVPRAVITGDTLFVGEVGRPDLMGGADLSAETMGGMLHDSLQRLMELPDDVLVYPGHGPGSACGRNIGPDTSSTIGRERHLNYAINIKDRDTFIRTVAQNLPVPPCYFPHAVRANRQGPSTVDDALSSLRPRSAAELDRLGGAGEALVVDTRTAAAYGAGHIPGSVNIGLDGRYAAWAGTVIDPARPLLLVTEKGRERESALRLARVGYDNAIGFLQGGIEEWEAAGLLLRTLPQLDVRELQRRMGEAEIVVLDVRGDAEWSDGHIADAAHRALPDLANDAANLPGGDAPMAVICGSGYRSSIACSLLERLGVERPLLNVVGGMGAWREADLPEQRPPGD